jgi:hypothetical protein
MLLHKEATTLAHLTFQACSMGGATWRPSIHETAVAEAFPNAFLAALCDEDDFPAKPAKSRKWTDELFPRVRDKCMAIVRALLPNREVIDENVCKCNFSNHEHVAAFVCALSALSVLANEAVLVGASDDGDIVLPPLRFWGWNAERTVPWAETALKTNVASCRLKFPNARVLDLAGGKTIA